MRENPMRGPMLLLILAAFVVGAFAELNLSAFSAPTALSFGFGTVQAPLGLILLGMMASRLVVFLAFEDRLHPGGALFTREDAVWAGGRCHNPVLERSRA